jgi:hypothetical protein
MPPPVERSGLAFSDVSASLGCFTLYFVGVTLNTLIILTQYFHKYWDITPT